MIRVAPFVYSDEQWAAVKTAVDVLGLDAEEIQRRITRAVGKTSIIGMPLRERIELAAILYRIHNTTSRRRLRRAELLALRRDAETLRASIGVALGIQFGLMISTRDYFTELLHGIDREIALAGQRGDNAKKRDRDWFWTELLSIWCALGGKPHGAAAADFLIAASWPVSNAVPTHTSVMQWLDRRRDKSARTLAKPVARRSTG